VRHPRQRIEVLKPSRWQVCHRREMKSVGGVKPQALFGTHIGFASVGMFSAGRSSRGTRSSFQKIRIDGAIRAGLG
jgi:hypothetical protein